MKTFYAVELFLNSRLAKGDQPTTIKWYRLIYEYLISYYVELPTNPEDVEMFLTHCKGGDERRHGFYRALKCLYRFLEKRYNIPNPVRLVDPPKRKHKVPNILTVEDLRKLLIYPHRPLIKAYLTFLIDTGCRPGELCHLKPADIILTTFGYIAKIDGKTGQRMIPLSDSVHDSILPWIPCGHNTDWITRKVTRAFQDAGLHGSCYTLRHTFATMWHGSEFALQSIMGHSNFQTLRVYRNLRIDYISQLHRVNSPLALIDK